MAAASDYLEDILFNWYFRGVAHTPPATFYVGLFTAAPTDAGGGTEVTGGGYARAAITRATGSWTAASGGNGSGTNVSALSYGTTTGVWGTVVAFGIFDAASSGNLLVWDTVGPYTIGSGTVVAIPANSLGLRFS